MWNLVFRVMVSSVLFVFLSVFAVRLSAPITGSDMVGYLSNRDDVRGQFAIYLHDMRTH